MGEKYDIAAYVWPAYGIGDKRARIFWDEGYGEWQSVKSAEKKFEGHSWPRKPLWGYVNEADPAVMEMEIEQAVSHGVNVFIYDWYWYDRRPFLENCLNDGFLKAKNRDKMKFYLMWANHDGVTFWDKRLDGDWTAIWDGKVDRKEFERVVNRIIEKYFMLDNYYKIDGCPVFDLYDLKNLVDGLGGIEETADALDYFREQTKKAGFPNLHLQLTLVGGAEKYNGKKLQGDPDSDVVSEFGEKKEEVFDAFKAIKAIKFDSATHYQFLTITNMDRNYEEIFDDVVKEWEELSKNPYFTYIPHVSMGWDNNPRTHRLTPCICKNNTPENIEKMLRLVKNFVDKRGLNPPLITINSWNEWTETSYLQPDDLHGYGYLEAIKKVFCDE